MKVIRSITEFQRELNDVKRPMGLVSTMGFLHAGHMALVNRARSENDTLAVSIFVNPIQFGPHEDYLTYPRDLQADLLKLKSAQADLAFVPPVKELYPDSFSTHIDVGHLGNKLEGESRPGHFKGVATVVGKLLAITRPDRAYFGQKDAQQCLLVKQLNSDLNLGAEIVVVPIVREPDGLALSSRNILLTQKERESALVIYKSLCLAHSLFEMGTVLASEIRKQICDLIERENLASVDYVSLADVTTLEEIDTLGNIPILVSMAVYIGKIRLIDNTILKPKTGISR